MCVCLCVCVCVCACVRMFVHMCVRVHLYVRVCMWLSFSLSLSLVPTGSPSRGGDVMVYVHSFLSHSCVCFCLYGPFNCISFHQFSRQLFAFSLRSSGLILPYWFFQLYVSLWVSLIPDIILCGWLGLKHQLTNSLSLSLWFSILNVLWAPLMRNAFNQTEGEEYQRTKKSVKRV